MTLAAIAGDIYRLGARSIHAELFVSLPAADVERQPLAELFAGGVLSHRSGT